MNLLQVLVDDYFTKIVYTSLTSFGPGTPTSATPPLPGVCCMMVHWGVASGTRSAGVV